MTAQKKTDQPASHPSPVAGSSGVTGGRKPWKKKSPTEVILEQVAKLREEVAAKEEDLQQAKKQLQKLEEVSKALEGS